MRENKERLGKTIRFSIRLPRELHRALKEESAYSKTMLGEYKSMNMLITEIIEERIKEKGVE